MPMPKIKLPSMPLPKVNAWKQELDKPAQNKYVRESPLIPQKGGYPIQLNQSTSGGTGIKLEDLESEPIRIIQNTPTGPQIRLIPSYSPFVMKGATEHMRKANANLDAENERIAVGLTSQWNGMLKLPQKPYAPLLKKNAPEVTEEELSTAVSNTELEEKSKEEEKKAFDTYVDNEKRASDPTGNPTWILRTSGQGPDKTFK